MNLYRHLFPISLVLLFVPSIYTKEDECKIKNEYRPYDMVESLLEAHIFVYGRDLNHTSSGEVKFMVYCTINANQDIPEQITIRNAIRPEDPCAPTKLTIGDDYIIMLKQTKEENLQQDMFRLKEPGISSTAAFEATPENLQQAANLCSVRRTGIKVPEDATQTAKTCPERTVTDETCVSYTSGGPALLSWVLGTVMLVVGGIIIS